jgi:hypothetical protein
MRSSRKISRRHMSQRLSLFTGDNGDNGGFEVRITLFPLSPLFPLFPPWLAVVRPLPDEGGCFLLLNQFVVFGTMTVLM